MRKKTEFIAPSIEDFVNYFLVNGYSESLAKRVYEGYSGNDWKDSRNTKIVNWKLKCKFVWFKDYNKNAGNNQKRNELEELGQQADAILRAATSTFNK